MIEYEGDDYAPICCSSCYKLLGYISKDKDETGIEEILSPDTRSILCPKCIKKEMK